LGSVAEAGDGKELHLAVDDPARDLPYAAGLIRIDRGRIAGAEAPIGRDAAVGIHGESTIGDGAGAVDVVAELPARAGVVVAGNAHLAIGDVGDIDAVDGVRVGGQVGHPEANGPGRVIAVKNVERVRIGKFDEQVL